MTRVAADDDLVDFIQKAKVHGVSDTFIVTLLRQNGWPERRVMAAFAALYSDALGVPIPKRAQRSENARDAFFYLLNFVSLGFWTVALGQMWYILIAHWLPDAAERAYTFNLRDEIAWQLATVIVAFPLFAFIHQRIGRDLERRPELYDSGVRKWLTYIALVLAAIVVLGDAVWFLGSLLTGELTARFVWDSVVLLVLGGGVFLYYLKTIDAPTAKA